MIVRKGIQIKEVRLSRTRETKTKKIRKEE